MRRWGGGRVEGGRRESPKTSDSRGRRRRRRPNRTRRRRRWWWRVGRGGDVGDRWGGTPGLFFFVSRPAPPPAGPQCISYTKPLSAAAAAALPSALPPPARPPPITLPRPHRARACASAPSPITPSRVCFGTRRQLTVVCFFERNYAGPEETCRKIRTRARARNETGAERKNKTVSTRFALRQVRGVPHATGPATDYPGGSPRRVC